MSGELTAYEMPNVSDATFKNNVEGGGSSYRTKWFVLNAANESEAGTVVAQSAPNVLSTLQGERLLIGPIRVARKTAEGMEVDVDYQSEESPQSQEPPEPGTWKFSFDTTGGTQKVTVGRSEVARYSRSQSDEQAPDLLGGIGYDGKKMEGVDIYVGKFGFEIDASYDAEVVTMNYGITLADATGTYNSATWLGCPGGTLLFLGATGQGDIPLRFGTRIKPIPIKLKFAYSKNQTNFTVGSMIITEKLGWDYLWVHYRKVESEGKLYPVPYWAYVTQVYEQSDFAALFGFGGS